MNKNLHLLKPILCIASLTQMLGCDAIFNPVNGGDVEDKQNVEIKSNPARDPTPSVSAAYEISDQDVACDPKKQNQCAFIPKEGCFGCYEPNGALVPVNMEKAKSVMTSKREECMKIFKEKFKNGPPTEKDKVSNDPSCQYDKGVCSPEGKCVLGKMTPQEEAAMNKKKEQMMEEMRKHMQNQNQGQQRM